MHAQSKSFFPPHYLHSRALSLQLLSFHELGHQLNFAEPNPTEVQADKRSVVASASSGQLHHQQSNQHSTPHLASSSPGGNEASYQQSTTGLRSPPNTGCGELILFSLFFLLYCRTEL